ncbi:hypothetical protein DMA11_16790 [Marinilabiliaceae bacterium JC017]|nr:hypothetical protein DMA11_16790 [Marinilabiliaceae bacterium JC017]
MRIISLVFLLFFSVSIQGKNKYSGGVGSIGKPYVIKNLDDLNELSQNPGDWSAAFKQESDIDASGSCEMNHGKGFSPIGLARGNFFKGTYDGNGFVIKGLVINDSGLESAGLFGVVKSAGIKNVQLVNCRVSGEWRVGLLIGESYSSYITNCSAFGKCSGQSVVGLLIGSSVLSQIDHCNSKGSILSRAHFVGGLIGKVYECLVSNSQGYLETEVETGECHNCGGLIGLSEAYSEVRNCQAQINITKVNSAGGLIGVLKESLVIDSFSEGSIKGGKKIGGLIGECDKGEVKSSWAIIDVMGNESVGGLIGLNTGNVSYCSANGLVEGVDSDERYYPESKYLGGLIGKSEYGLISCCWSGGAVIGKRYIGGLVGGVRGGSIINSYASGYVFGEKYVGGLVGVAARFDQINSSFSIGRTIGLAYAGGLIGLLEARGYVKMCYASGKVIGQYSVGGCVGCSREGVVTNQCYFSGSVIALYKGNKIRETESSYAGGFVGECDGSVFINCYADATVSGKSIVGGFGGSIEHAKVLKCYVTGSIQSLSTIGRFVEALENSEVVGCYQNVSVSGEDNSVGFAGRLFGGSGISDCFTDSLNRSTFSCANTDKLKILSKEEYLDSVGFKSVDFQLKAGSEWRCTLAGDAYLNKESVIIRNEELTEDGIFQGYIILRDKIKIKEKGIRYRFCQNGQWENLIFSGKNLKIAEILPLSHMDKHVFIQGYVEDTNGHIYYGNMICSKYRTK